MTEYRSQTNPPGVPLVEKPRRAKPRLTELLRVLEEELPAVLNGHKFNMRNWAATVETMNATYVAAPRTPVTSLECNTAACAAGWGAILSPKLRRVGLRFSKNNEWCDEQMSVFGLTLGGSRFLFSPAVYPPDAIQGEPGRLEACHRIRLALEEIS